LYPVYHNYKMHDTQELLADTLLELKLCRCKEVVSERTKSILQKKLQLAKDETLWLLDKKSRDKEEVCETNMQATSDLHSQVQGKQQSHAQSVRGN
jgi:hypothetical protein